jgi:hypothetical protein
MEKVLKNTTMPSKSLNAQALKLNWLTSGYPEIAAKSI